MRRNIAVLIQEVSVDYTLEVLYGIYSYFKDKDVNVFFCQTRLPWTERGLFETQYWSTSKIIASKQIDCYIIISATYCSTVTPEELVENFSNISDRKIISVGIPIALNRSTTISVSCQKAYFEVIKHLKEEHGCKRIAFISATKTKSIEAIDRFEAFKDALKKNDLEFDKDIIYHGNFNYVSAYDELKNKIHSKEDVHFDAILSSSDLMAFGAISYLTEIGIKIPEEVKVIGYDNVVQSQNSDFPLSTISQELNTLGIKAAEFALAYANGEYVAPTIKIDAKVIFRHSCGCTFNRENSLTINGVNSSVDKALLSILQNARSLDRIYYLLDRIQADETMDKLLENFSSIIPDEEISSLALCLYDTPLTYDNINNFRMPKKCCLELLHDKDRKIFFSNLKKEFNPHDSLLPDINQLPAGIYLVQPVFNANTQYGYIVAKIRTPSFSLLNIYFKIFSNVLSRSYQYSQKILENSSITKTSNTDELTNTFNRRGLLEFGQDAIDFSLNIGKNGAVLFGDMDGLKKINDNFGHEMGDKAIKAQALVLQRCLRSSDIIGRIGGDEFAAVLPGMDINFLPKLKEKIFTQCSIVSKELGLPFEIKISIGMVEFNYRKRQLTKLLPLADKEQYIEKRLHHAERKD